MPISTMIGQKLGSFLIEAEIGAGAMGVVYRGVRDSGKTRVAAVKVIGVDQMAKGKAFERFVREAEILEQFRHPNIVRYLARGKQGKTFYYAMEFIPGQTLDGLIEAGGAMPWEEVARLGVQICDALHYAHEHGVVHRDLKPSNLMVTIDGDVKLTDFGIAKDLDATALTATGRTMGTAAFMAPEQIRGTPEVSHKTDLYALGIVLYQMLTGELPFQGTSAVVLMHCQMNEPAPRASAKTQVIPVALDELVLKLMAKSPTDRPWDAAAVAVTLRELLDKHEAGQPIPMVWPEVGSPASNPPTRSVETLKPTKMGRKKKKKKHAMERLRDLAPVLGLVAALVVVGSLIGYIVWPPSAAYLFRQAEPLMNSEKREDWLRAQSMYLDELERRFPDHPYRAQTDPWYDRLALTSAERRAEVLEKSAVPGFKKAEGQGESLYAAVFPEAEAAIKRFDDLDAARRWREMAASLEKDNSRLDRGWLLLARKKADQIERAIKERAAKVAELLVMATQAHAAGQADQALKLRRDALERFSKYTDTAALLDPVRAMLADEKKPDATGDGTAPVEAPSTGSPK
ncbi:MAG TPA: serine/threonine-protein kinase [Isosphaeraceae bacterium]